jgi:alkanesulfonate monooxygenase SsuD/methylene tetrahydromethanopterin reductase-like flavin-dependent oxidoreductase (luciferase family)
VVLELITTSLRALFGPVHSPATAASHGRPYSGCETIAAVELAVHLPLMEFGDEGQSLERLARTVDAARECGFAAVSANDHFVFSTPWLDGTVALAAVVERSGDMDLVTTLSLVALRGPVPVAKTLAALDLLSDGRLIAGVGPGSSERDYDAVAMPFEERWKRFDEATAILRGLLRDEPLPESPRYYAVPDAPLAPGPIRSGGVPVWIGSWGSRAGLRRVAELGDGWFASGYNTTPERFRVAKGALSEELQARGRDGDRFPNGLVTMWTWLTEDAGEADRVLREVLTPVLKRDREDLRDQLCIGPAERCAELLARYADAGCERVHLWPLGDEPRQIELAATTVLPSVQRD